MTILENMLRLRDEDLLVMLPYIRDENGEKVSLIELKHFLKEEKEKRREKTHAR